MSTVDPRESTRAAVPGELAADARPAGPPPAVRVAFVALLVAVGLSVLGLILALVSMNETIDVVVARRLELDPEADVALLRSTTRASVYSAMVGAASAAALTLFLACRIRAGRNWARVTMSVLLVGNLVLSLLSLAVQTPHVIQLLLQVIALIWQLVALVALWRPESGPHFARRAAERRRR